MTLHVFDDLEALDESSLVVGDCRAAGFPFDLAWYRHFVATVDLGDVVPQFFVWSAADDCRATVILPCLVRQRQVGPIRLRELHALANYYSPLFAPLFAPLLAAQGETPEREFARLLQAIVRSSSWHSIELGPLDADAPTTRCALAALSAAGWQCHTADCFVNWREPVLDGLDAYLAARPSALRNTARRKRRRFDRLPDSHLAIYTAAAGIDRAIADYEHVYANSWKAAEPHAGFMPGLIRQCARQGTARLGIAYIDAQPVAAHFWIVEAGVAHIYKLAYDSEHAATSPGTVLMLAMLEHVIGIDRVNLVDFLSGDDAYKAQWMTQSRPRVTLMGHNLRSVAGIIGRTRQVMLPGLKALVCQGVGTTNAGTERTDPSVDSRS